MQCSQSFPYNEKRIDFNEQVLVDKIPTTFKISIGSPGSFDLLLFLKILISFRNVVLRIFQP